MGDRAVREAQERRGVNGRWVCDPFAAYRHVDVSLIASARRRQ